MDTVVGCGLLASVVFDCCCDKICPEIGFDASERPNTTPKLIRLRRVI